MISRQDAKRLGDKSAGNVEFARSGRSGGVGQPHKVRGIVEAGRGRNSGRQGRGEVTVSDVGGRPFPNTSRAEAESRVLSHAKQCKPSRPPYVEILPLHLLSDVPIGRYQNLIIRRLTPKCKSPRCDRALTLPISCWSNRQNRSAGLSTPYRGPGAIYVLRPNILRHGSDRSSKGAASGMGPTRTSGRV